MPITAVTTSLMQRLETKVPQTTEITVNLLKAGNDFDELADSITQNTTLLSLTFTRCIFKRVSAVKLGIALSSHPTLANVTFLSCFFEDEANVLITKVLENRALRFLHIQSSRIGDEGVYLIADTLPQNTQLTELSLHNNEISDYGATAISNIMQKNTSITNLSLSQHSISPVGLHALQKMLESNATLRSLFLWNGNFSLRDEGAPFLKALENNTTLTELTIDDELNPIDCKLIEACLERNKKIRKENESNIIKSIILILNANTSSFSTHAPELPLEIVSYILQANGVFDEKISKNIINHVNQVLRDRSKLSEDERNIGTWLTSRHVHNDGKGRQFKLTPVVTSQSTDKRIQAEILSKESIPRP